MSVTSAANAAILRFNKLNMVPRPTEALEIELINTLKANADTEAQVSEAAQRLIECCQFYPKVPDVIAIFEEIRRETVNRKDFAGLAAATVGEGAPCICGGNRFVSTEDEEGRRFAQRCPKCNAGTTANA